MRFYLETLGCPKNEVDSEGMAKVLARAGYSPVDRPARADILIVNTCGFIDIAIAESTEAIQNLAARKRSGQLLIAAGCLAQRYARELGSNVPEIDAVIGTRDLERIVDVVEAAREGRKGEKEGVRSPLPSRVLTHPSAEGRVPRRVEDRAEQATPLKPSAYLKIGDGCSAACAFCVIPQIKGPYLSKSPREVIEEAQGLAIAGTKEIVLIAQDTTAYGYDWGERDALAGLLPAILSAAPELLWLRLMYAYPTRITHRLIEAMALHPQICHYLDLPIQHAHPAVLQRMRRPSDLQTVRDLIRRLREAIPDLALRTSFIVGFPGETESEFRTLLEFMEEIAFDRVGVFAYSQESGTPAALLPAQVPDSVKQQRYERAMELQQRLSLERNRAQIGRELDVIVEGVAEVSGRNKKQATGTNDFHVVGRSYRDAPEVDGLVLCSGRAQPGEVVRVKVVDALEYDLLARIVKTREALPSQKTRVT